MQDLEGYQQRENLYRKTTHPRKMFTHGFMVRVARAH